MPNIGDLVGRVIGLVGELIGSSSLRLGTAPTLVILGLLLVLLSLLARPAGRWTPGDRGHLARTGHLMALAAEAGTEAAFSLGTAGVARGTRALDRLQTLAALPILGHVARAAARGGVTLRVTANDPVAVLLAEQTVEQAHRRMGTLERLSESGVTYVGEGRPTAAALALAEQQVWGGAFVAGGLAEEGLLLLHGMADGATATSFGSADVGQAPMLLLEGEGTLVGPELYQTPGDIRSNVQDWTAAFTANRLIWLTVAVLVGASALLLLGVPGIPAFFTGR